MTDFMLIFVELAALVIGSLVVCRWLANRAARKPTDWPRLFWQPRQKPRR